MTKDEIIRRIDDEKPSIHQVKGWLKTISSGKTVSSLRKGDVIAYLLYKRRPVVVVKVTKDNIYGIPLSSTEDEHNLCAYSSRQFGNGFFNKSLVTMKPDICKNNFIGTFDNFKDLNKAVKLLKELIMKL